MTKKMKQLLAMMMVMVMMFTLIPTEAFAQDLKDSDVDDAEYVIDDADVETEEAQYDGPVAELRTSNPEDDPIGTYNTLQEAFTAAEGQEEYVIVKLLQDVTLTGDYILDQSINLFLNEHVFNVQEDATISHSEGVDSPQIHVWGDFSSKTGGSFITNGEIDAHIVISPSTIDFSVEGGYVKYIQSFGGNLEISGGTIDGYCIDDGEATITGGTIKDLDMLNNMGSPTLDIKGNVSVTRCLLGYYTGERAGTATVTISGAPMIAALGFEIDEPGEGTWGSLTITGGYFGNNPSTLVGGMSEAKRSHLDVDMGEFEAYTDQADWAVDHDVYGWRLVDANPSADYVVKVDYRYMDGVTNPDPTYETVKYESIEAALKAIEEADYIAECPANSHYYHPLLTLLKDVTIDKVINHTLNQELGQIFVEMNGHKLVITDNGGLTGSGILMFEGTKTGKFISSGVIGLTGNQEGNIFIFKGCDLTVTGGTVSSKTQITTGDVNISGGEFTENLYLYNSDPDKGLKITISGSAKMKDIRYEVNKLISSISLNLIGGYYAQDPESFKTNGTKVQSDYVNYDENKLEQYANQADWEADPATYTYRIKREVSPASYSVTPAAKTGLVENGSAQELITAGTAVGGTVKYAPGTDATTVPTSGWSTNIPTGTAAGTYYVWYRLDPDAEHSAIAAACITVTIAARSSEDPTNNDPVNNEETTTEEPTPTPTPVPVDNSDDSPFSPVPEITATTESLYLIKGQTFSLNDTGWTSTNKKVVSVSKTGAVKAIKVTGNTPVELTKGADAAKKTLKIYVTEPKVKEKKLNVSAGKTVNAEITADFKDKLPVYWYSSAEDIATVDQTGKVTGITKGKAVINAQINGKAFTINVTVNEDTVLAERTLHMTKDTNLTVKKLGNVSITGLASTSSNVAVNKKKITAKETGTAIVEATGKDGKTYKINLIIEDPTITNLTAGKTNKYSVEIKAGTSHAAIKFKAYDREAVFKSSKPKVAYVNEKGEIIGLSKGNANLTTKINGKTITIKVKVTN